MTRFKRHILLGTTLVVLVLLGLGGWFYFTFLGSTNTALLRAETFLFRRMKVAQLAEKGSYRFFYVTNRRLGSDDGPIEERFGKEREEILKYGYFDAKIQPSLGLGMLINATEWFQNEEIRLKEVRELEQTAFVSQVRRLIQDSPYRSLLVLVHGFKEAFPSAMRKTAFLSHVLDVNTPVLLFDWPGNQGGLLGPDPWSVVRRQGRSDSSNSDRSLHFNLN